jgi:hypothetical protein
MGTPRYGQDAIDYCFKLYLKYNGQQPGRIEREMQKAGWVGWKAQNLKPRGYGANRKPGWIESFGWENALREHVASKVAPTLNSAEKLVRDIEMVCDGLAAEIRSKGVAKTDKERLQLFRDFGNLQIGAITKVQAARDTLGAWVVFFEKLIEWGVDIDSKLGRALVKHSDALIARAEKEFGEEQNAGEELSMNAKPDSEDEGA